MPPLHVCPGLSPISAPMSLCVACILAPFGQPLPWGGGPPPIAYGVGACNFVHFFACGHSPPAVKCLQIAASRRLLAYDTPVYVILFIPLSLFLISAPRCWCWWRSGIPSHLFIVLAGSFWHIFSTTSCINFSKWPAVSRRSPRC
jgi:hypothetical protein